MISGTIEPMGTTLAGQSIEAFYISVEHMNPIAVGLNCATGPEFMQDHIRSLSNLAIQPLAVTQMQVCRMKKDIIMKHLNLLAQKLADFAAEGWLNIVGGCCGTTPEHIKAIAETMKKYQPRETRKSNISIWFPGLNPLFMMIRH